MKILLIGNKSKSYNIKRLTGEVKKLGHKFRFILWKELLFLFRNNKKINIRVAKTGRDISNYDYIIARAPTFPSSRFKKKFTLARLSRLYEHFLIIIDYMKRGGKHVLNEPIVNKIPHYTKLFQYYHLTKNGLPIVPSLLYTGGTIPPRVYEKFPLPYIIKGIKGSRGKDVFKITDISQIKDLVKKYGRGMLLVQKYIPLIEDYRIIVLNGKIIGGIKRVAAPRSFKTNISQGGRPEKIEVNKKMADIALKAARVFNAEFAGIDLVKDKKGNYYIFEVNLFPIFEGFETATGINVAKEIIKFAETKVGK